MNNWIKKVLPIGGEWYKDGYIEFIDAANQMEDAGMDRETIQDILESLYSAVTREYGE